MLFPFSGLLFLLENPNFDDPISPIFQPRDTLTEYAQDIANHRQGNSVGFMKCLLDEAISSCSERINENVQLQGETTLSQKQNFDVADDNMTEVSDKSKHLCCSMSESNRPMVIWHANHV